MAVEETKQSQTITDGEPRVGLWRRLKRWMRAHHVTIMTLPDTPHAIALGSAIGMFFGFSPLFGMKSSLAFFITWALKANKTAAVITVQLHDLLLPLVPAMFLWQYKLGMWALYHRLPQRPGFSRVSLSDFMEWTTFLTVGRPILVGSLFFAVPAALVVYFGLRGVLIRSRAPAATPKS
ncbi:MAG TPA: DUF2062 domain-containing protein [Chthoniobacterales bacterium]|nr:DUF2062 domain-containing protein [Chthoniobacterales bacterium]